MNNASVTLQTSKKILIFLYVICIFVFIFLSLFFLHIKSEYFRKALDARVASVLNSNPFVRASYENIEGDLLSKVEFFGLAVGPADRAHGATGWSFTSNRSSIELYPLSHIVSYLVRSGIPAGLNFYASRFVAGGETVEIGVFANKFSVDYAAYGDTLKLRFETVLDASSKFFKTAPASPIAVKGEAVAGGGRREVRGSFAAPGCSLSLAGQDAGTRLSFRQAGAACEFFYDAGKKLLSLSSAEVRLDTCSVRVASAFCGFLSGALELEVSATAVNTADIFRAFPVSKLLVMSESAEAELSYSGNFDDLRGGSLTARLLFTRAKLLEYNTEENRVFTDAGAGDFVSSLGLTPDLVARAETVEAKLALRGREFIIESLRIKAPDYTFKASARADSNDRLDGNFTLSIPRRVLARNTLKADFSGMPGGIKIYGRIMGDIYNPLIIYDMDGAAIIKITEGVMYDKLKNMFGK